MKLRSWWQMRRRTAGGFLLEAALLALLFWLPAVWPGSVSPAIEISMAVSAAYLLWATGAAAWGAQVGLLRSAGFTILFLIAKFYLIVSVLYILGFVVGTGIDQWDISLLAVEEFTFPAVAFVVSLGVVWLATVCLPRPLGELKGRIRTRFGLLLPVALIAGLADVAVPWNGVMTLAQIEMSGSFEPTDEALKQAWTWAWAWPWLWSLPLGAVLFVAYERALTASLSRLYGAGPGAPESRRALMLRWSVTLPSVIAVLWIFMSY